MHYLRRAFIATALALTFCANVSATVISNWTELGPFGAVASSTAVTNSIGIPGTQGFGVGVASTLPAGMAPIAGYNDVTSANYGNYMYADASVMVYIPKFYYKVGTGSNGLVVNRVDIRGTDLCPTTAACNNDGYALHRAFIDGGAEKAGFFFDKYEASRNAKGTGYVASSIKDGNPLSTHADHNPVTGLTAVSTNAYWSTIIAAKARDGVNGAVNANSIFHVGSMYQYSALAMLSLAHGQAATATTYCAWYDATGVTNFPKGNNNNALKDANDATVVYVTDGYSNAGKTGSAGLFSKTTHNGQANGIADINGNMWEVGLGMTAIAAAKTITAATQANPCAITIASHGYTTGDDVMILSVGGMTQVNDKIYKITVVDANTFTLDGIDSSAYTAYTTGGSSTKGTFYAAKQATSMKSFTSGTSAATDHWGATGVAAMMDAISFPMVSGGAFAQKLGNSTNQVFSEATSGAGWLATGLALPKDSGGVSTAGTNLYGTDYYYQYIRNELFPIVGGGWSNSATAGVFARNWGAGRADSNGDVGFRCACYPD